MTEAAVRAAVRNMRLALGESQEQFAKRLKTTVRTISRYETDQPPRGFALQKMWQIAKGDKRCDDYVEEFAEAIRDEITVQITTSEFMAHLAETVRASVLPQLHETVVTQIAADDPVLHLTKEEKEVLGTVLLVLRGANQEMRAALLQMCSDRTSFVSVIRRSILATRFAQELAGLEEMDSRVTEG